MKTKELSKQAWDKVLEKYHSRFAIQPELHEFQLQFIALQKSKGVNTYAWHCILAS